jgi:hypothetical protein
MIVVMIMPVIMTMVMVVIVVVAVPVTMVMTVRMIMVMIVMVQPLARPWPARVLVEDERFNGDRHRIGRHADTAEIDIVEVPQHHAVDDQKLACDV